VPAIEPYSLEQVELDLADLRGQVDRLSEVLTKLDSTDAPNIPAAGIIHHSMTGQHKYASSDGNYYNTGRQTLFTTGTQTIGSLTGVNITGLTCPVAAVTYRVSGKIIWVQGTVAAQQAIGINGPAVSNMRVTVNHIQESGAAPPVGESLATTEITSLGRSGTPAYGIGLTIQSHIDGLITFSAAGTLALQGSCVTAAADTFAIQAYSFIDVMPVS
jgi:hypothetical protein